MITGDGILATVFITIFHHHFTSPSFITSVSPLAAGRWPPAG
jgi:hypothetical protein